jgi:prophage regulatory protein
MQTNNTATPIEFWRLPRVRKACGDVSAATVWNWAKNSDKTGFPKPIKLSETGNCTVWIAAEIEAWAQSRVAASRSQT